MREPDWLDAIPSGRPAMIVADGLMGFLSRDEFVSLLNRIISHFPSGEMVFNSYTPFTIWVAHHAPGTKTVADLVKFPGFKDPHEPESWNPKLELIEEILLSRDLARFHRSFACTTGCRRTADPGPGREPSSCISASSAGWGEPRGLDP